MWLKRPHYEARIQTALARARIVLLVGPRQCGKSTLARRFVASDSLNYFDLEDPRSLARLDQPLVALEPLKGTVVIDEVQRRPELFPILRVLCDRTDLPGQFLLLGSASPELLHQSSESLAGRTEIIEMGGFSLADLGPANFDAHWLRGGFPRSYLARDEEESLQWRRDFIQTFLERDLPQFGLRLPATTLHRFWSLLAHFHARLGNLADLARSLGMSENSVRRYLDLLTSLYMVRQLPPFHANLKKRQVKSPKIFLRDSGLLHSLLGITTQKELLLNPIQGFSYEGYVIEEILRLLPAAKPFFWATHQGAELDLLLFHQGKKLGFEIKREDAPRLTPSMKIALQNLELDRLTVIYPGTLNYRLGERVEVVGATAFLAGGEKMQGIVSNL